MLVVDPRPSELTGAEHVGTGQVTSLRNTQGNPCPTLAPTGGQAGTN